MTKASIKAAFLVALVRLCRVAGFLFFWWCALAIEASFGRSVVIPLSAILGLLTLLGMLIAGQAFTPSAEQKCGRRLIHGHMLAAGFAFAGGVNAMLFEASAFSGFVSGVGLGWLLMDGLVHTKLERLRAAAPASDLSTVHH